MFFGELVGNRQRLAVGHQQHADGQPGDKLCVAETEVVDGIRVRVSGHSDLFVAVAADDVLAAVEYVLKLVSILSVFKPNNDFLD